MMSGICLLLMLLVVGVAATETYGEHLQTSVSTRSSSEASLSSRRPGRLLQVSPKTGRRQQRIQLQTQSDAIEIVEALTLSKDQLISRLVRENKVKNEPADDPGMDTPMLSGGISRVLHQSWKNRELPAHFKHWQQTWKVNHPGWEYRLWTDADNRNLVTKHYPWLLPTYEGFSHEIYRADFARQLYMHRYGGVYVDLDVESLQPIDPLIANLTVVVARMGTDESFGHSIPNAFMASEPGHIFWMFVVAEILRGATERRQPELMTGPVMLRQALLTYQEHLKDDPKCGNVSILAPEHIYPLNWADPYIQECDPRKEIFDTAKCKQHFPDAYAVTYWTHSWG